MTSGAAPEAATGLRLSIRPMAVADLDPVMTIENGSYDFPWSRGNFIDSLAAGYTANVGVDAGGAILGYFVAMHGVDELHLLNITVAAAARGRGLCSRLVARLCRLARSRQAVQVWLEVRSSNLRAQAIYRHLGFLEVGLRKGYYPAPAGRREDAVLMSLRIDAAATAREADDGLE